VPCLKLCLILVKIEINHNINEESNKLSRQNYHFSISSRFDILSN